MRTTHSTFPFASERSELFGRSEVARRGSQPPRAAGLYAWYFKSPPSGLDTSGCYRSEDDLTLLYVGISCRQTPSSDRPMTNATLRNRLSQHFNGNAFASTLRLSLGCLLADEIGIELRRVGSGARRIFVDVDGTNLRAGEERLNAWLDQNAFVCWETDSEPWVLEKALLATGPRLPLNIQGNPYPELYEPLQAVRRLANQHAKSAPVWVPPDQLP